MAGKLNEKEYRNVRVIIAPQNILLQQTRKTLYEKYEVVAQNVSGLGVSGSFTGETGIESLKSIGIKGSIIGHSERRMHMQEFPEYVAKQVELALHNGMLVVFCVGETEREKEKGKTAETISAHLNPLLPILERRPDLKRQLIVAYEPVWAIGTGKVATAKDIQEAVEIIRDILPDPEISVLYGGSVGAKNAKDLLSVSGISGFLVGKASLTQEFIEICNECNSH